MAKKCQAMNEKRPLKSIELKVLSELMKNSRRSDRELSKAIGVSQPTVSRTINRLEKEGIVREFTAIPDLPRLGYKILTMTFVTLNHTLSQEEIEKARKLIKETLESMPFEILMLERGMGMGYDGVILSYHKDYTSQMQFVRLLKETGFLDLDRFDIFRVNLEDEVRFLPVSFSLIAQSISMAK